MNTNELHKTECNHECEMNGEHCETANPDGLICTRLAGHAGPHVACNEDRHALAVWPKDKVIPLMESTPGPWEFGSQPYNVEHIAPFADWRRDIVGPPDPHKANSSLVICSVVNCGSPEGKANAALIVSSPDLYAALQEIANLAVHKPRDSYGNLANLKCAVKLAKDALDKALSKAKGVQ